MLPLLVAVLLADATPPALSAREIYLRARAAVSAIPLPPYVIFTFTEATNYAVQVRCVDRDNPCKPKNDGSTTPCKT
jgi:hypothetical protein